MTAINKNHLVRIFIPSRFDMISDLEAISLSNVANFSTLVTWHATICRRSSVLSLSFGASLSDCFKTSLKSIPTSSASISSTE